MAIWARASKRLVLELLAMLIVSVLMFFESSVAGSLRLGTHGVVASSMGLHVVPGANSPLGIPNVPRQEV